jgi:hypothetical protein
MPGSDLTDRTRTVSDRCEPRTDRSAAVRVRFVRSEPGITISCSRDNSALQTLVELRCFCGINAFVDMQSWTCSVFTSLQSIAYR